MYFPYSAHNVLALTDLGKRYVIYYLRSQGEIRDTSKSGIS